MANALKFKHTQVPRQNGELARLKVMQGPDTGAIYVITGIPATIGRGEDNDLVISDLKASRKHAQFMVLGREWSVKDMGSANGLLHNGKPTRQGSIKTGDTLSFGETTLEFLLQEAGTKMLMSPVKSLDQVRSEEKAFEVQKQKARTFGIAASGAGAPIKAASSGGLFSNPLLVGVVGIGAALLLFVDSEPQPKRKSNAKASKEERNLAAYLPAINPDDTSSGKTADAFFKAGFREYREKNYLRAKIQFETALQVVPGHPLATLYLENCDKAIESEVKSHLEIGKKSMNSGKLKSALGHFESVKRLLYREQNNPAYLEATDQAEAVRKALNGGSGV